MPWAVEAWRLWSLLYLVFYAAAAVLAVVLPLHLLEHSPWLTQPTRPWVLYLLLVAAGLHGSIGLHRVVRDHARGRAARLLGDVAALITAAVTIGVGLVGLASLTGW